MELITTMPITPLVIELPDSQVELLPAPRSRLRELRQLILKLQSFWLENQLSTGDTVADEGCWELMKAAMSLLPRKDAPAVTGVDLELISNDYAQLEQLFFADTKAVEISELHNWSVFAFDMEKFVGCRLLLLHGVNPKQLIREADELREQRLKSKRDTEIHHEQRVQETSSIQANRPRDSGEAGSGDPL